MVKAGKFEGLGRNSTEKAENSKGWGERVLYKRRISLTAQAENLKGLGRKSLTLKAENLKS